LGIVVLMQVKAAGESAVVNLVLPGCNDFAGRVGESAVQVIAILIITGVFNQAFGVETGEDDEWYFVQDALVLFRPVQQSPDGSTFIPVDSCTDVDGFPGGAFVFKYDDWLPFWSCRDRIDLKRRLGCQCLPAFE